MSRYLKVSLRFGGSVHTDAFLVGKTFQAGGKTFSRPKKHNQSKRGPGEMIITYIIASASCRRTFIISKRQDKTDARCL